jgi:hypothetical protein
MKITKQHLKKLIKEEIGYMMEEPDMPDVSGTQAAAAMGRRETGFDPMGYQEITPDALPGEPGSAERESALADLLEHQIENSDSIGTLKEEFETLKTKFDAILEVVRDVDPVRVGEISKPMPRRRED